MIGNAIKKYAEHHGMNCDGGYAYGKIHGRHIALEDRYGAKILQIYLHPPARSAEKSGVIPEEVQRTLLDCSAREYRLLRQEPVTVGGGRAVIAFGDNPGTMARVERYIDEVLPRLDALALNTDICAYCGEPLTGEVHYVLLDDYVLPVHGECVREMAEQVAETERAPKQGSVAKGAAGAVIGAAIGAIAWAVVFVLGYVTSVCGLLIGFLSNWLYGKFGGRAGALRVVVVTIALVFGVTLGQAVGATALFAHNYEKIGGLDNVGVTCTQYVQCCWDRYIFADQSRTLGNVYDRMVSNIPEEERGHLISREDYIREISSESYADDRAELLRESAENLGMGMFFGLLGCAGLFAQLSQRKRMRIVRMLK